jgi:co-chaperonin GroES (HSP10)
MTITPCGHRILVRPIKLEESDEVLRAAAKAGIFLVESERKKEQAAMDTGFVEAVGPTAFRDFGGDAWCKVGDKIAFAKYGGKYIGDMLILNDEDVVAVLKD